MGDSMTDNPQTATEPTLDQCKEWLKMRILASEGIDAEWNRMLKGILLHLPEDVCTVTVKPDVMEMFNEPN
jgi:hypothetical protein